MIREYSCACVSLRIRGSQDEEAYFEAWYAYTQYLFAHYHHQPAKYAQFLTTVLQRNGFPEVTLTETDVAAIQTAEQTSRADISAAYASVTQATQKLVKEAGSRYSAYQKANIEAASRGLEPKTAAARASDLLALRDAALTQVKSERALLKSDIDPGWFVLSCSQCVYLRWNAACPLLSVVFVCLMCDV